MLQTEDLECGQVAVPLNIYCLAQASILPPVAPLPLPLFPTTRAVQWEAEAESEHTWGPQRGY